MWLYNIDPYQLQLNRLLVQTYLRENGSPVNDFMWEQGVLGHFLVWTYFVALALGDYEHFTESKVAGIWLVEWCKQAMVRLKSKIAETSTGSA